MDASDSGEDSDYTKGNPEMSEDVYKDAFFAICTEFFNSNFDKHRVGFIPPGYDHADFRREVAKLVDGIDDREPVYTHVICNQYAEAAGSNKRAWETHHQLRDYYKNGKLPRREAPSDLDLLAGLSSDEDGSDSASPPASPPPKPVLVCDVLKELKIQDLRDVSRKSEVAMQRMWLNKKKVEAKESTSTAQTYVVYEYPDNEESRTMIHEAVKLTLVKLAQSAAKRGAQDLLGGTPPLRKKQKVVVEEPQQEVHQEPETTGGFAGYTAPGFNMAGFSSTPGAPTDRVYWGDVLEQIGIEDTLLGCDNTEELMKDIKMACGRNFIAKYKGPKPNPVTGRREYTNEHLENMMTIAREVKNAVANNMARK